MSDLGTRNLAGANSNGTRAASSSGMVAAPNPKSKSPKTERAGELSCKLEARMRHNLAWVAIVLIVSFLVGSALYGLSNQNFAALSTVWNTSQVFIGALLGYYFAMQRNGDR